MTLRSWHLPELLLATGRLLRALKDKKPHAEEQLQLWREWSKAGGPELDARLAPGGGDEPLPDASLRSFVDEVAPKHVRTSCTDEDSRGNEFFNELGYPRCVRCAMLHRVLNGCWPHGAEFRIVDLRTATGDDSAKGMTSMSNSNDVGGDRLILDLGPRDAELLLVGLRRLDTDMVREAEDSGLMGLLSEFVDDFAEVAAPTVLPNGRVQGGPEDRAHWWTCSTCHFTGPLVGLREDGTTRACLASCGGVTPNPETTTFKDGEES